MDWSKTKSIFIFVFLILNIFLYSQYLDSYKEGQKLELLGDKNMEARLKDDNITYDTLPKHIETAPYLTAKVKGYTLDELPSGSNFSYKLITDHILMASAKVPIKLEEPTQSLELTQFVEKYVYKGSSFVLWDIDEEARVALFSQRFNKHTLYFNKNGYVKVHWNSDNEIYMYEQSMLENIEELEQEEEIVPPLEALQALYAKNLLNTDDYIEDMNLGYSTLVQFTQTQVFAPTWEVHIETASGEERRHFVNAVEGNVVDINNDAQQVLEE